jgi:trigger factor
VEDTIQENDMIKIAARELDGDSVREGGLETTMSFLVKSIANEDVKTQLLGMKAGDTIRFNARSLEGYDKEDMYRKYVLNLDPSDNREVNDMFDGTIESVSRLQEAEMDEEFFKNYFNNDAITTADSAIEELKKGIRRFYDTRTDAVLMRKLQDHLMDLNKIDLPEKFLKRWLAATNRGELSEEQIEREFPAFAENLRWTIVRDDIKERFSVEVTDEDIREAFTQKLRNYFSFEMPAHLLDSTINRMMENKKDVEETQRDIELEKLFNAIRDQVSITEKPVSSSELHEIVESLNATAKKEQQASEITL